MKKVAIKGSMRYGGEGKVTKALVEFLQEKGYEVAHFSNLPSHHQLRRWYYKVLGNGKRIFTGSSEGDPYVKNLAERIKSERFDATIAVGAGDILLHDLSCIKIFFCRAPVDHEVYFKMARWIRYRPSNGDPDLLDIVAAESKNQLDIFRASDYVTFAWKTYEKYVRNYIYNGSNILPNPRGGWSGSEVRSKRAIFRLPPAIVYLGSMERYFNNMPLLSRLASNLPYVLDVYGTPAPNKKYGLCYRGTMPNMDDTLPRYQFGLNTVTSEILRRNGFSSKVLTYLSYGLPCLFNDWEKFPHELGGCVSYTEENISEVIERFFDRDAWEELSEEAYSQAQDLLWSKILTPLIDVLK